ncbi:MAG: glycosyltransferase family 2 protein [Ideonella sp.]|nr:glycosyltransferase family 2 protein [Ideonella sp.]
MLVCCIRNERPRLKFFLEYYRTLGVQHFLFVDNCSTDDSGAFIDQQGDCSRWLATGSYKAANFGMDWCNHLLTKYGDGKWCITVDPDEFLVYPHIEYRGLRSLTRHLESMGQDSLFTLMIDSYSDNPLSSTRMLTEESNPFEVCQFFDRFNFVQQFNSVNGNFWIQGGPRLRCLFHQSPERAPALNKVCLVRWRKGLRYESSMHHLNVQSLNGDLRYSPEATSGAIFHFKYVNLLATKAQEEMNRGEHYDNSFEYKAYADAPDLVFFDPAVSIKYIGSHQLLDHGFLQAGIWF